MAKQARQGPHQGQPLYTAGKALSEAKGAMVLRNLWPKKK